MARMEKQPHGGALRMIEKGDKTPGAGRPKKGWGALNQKLEAEGIEAVSKDSYRKVVIRLMSCSEDKLKEIQKDTKTPMWIRWIIGDLGNSKTRARLMEDLRNYTLGDSAADLEDSDKKSTKTIIHHHHKIMKKDESSKNTDKENIGEVEQNNET